MTDDSYLNFKKSLNFIVVLYIFINIYNTILYSPQIQKTVICHLSSAESTIRRIRAENRSKSKGKIWRRAEKFVPLHRE